MKKLFAIITGLVLALVFIIPVKAQTVPTSVCPEGFYETAGDVWAIKHHDYQTDNTGGIVKMLPNNGTTWQEKPILDDTGWLNIAINNSTGDVWALNYHDSRIRMLPYNGTTWQDMPTFPHRWEGTYALSVNSTTGDVWAIEYDGSVLMLPNGSPTWVDMPDPGNDAPSTWYDISVNSTTGDVWAINRFGGSVKILPKDGLSWQDAPPATIGGASWYGISVNSNTGDVWALRDDGTVIMLPNNSSSWEMKPALDVSPLGHISVNSNTGDVWVVTYNGIVKMLPNGAASWLDKPALDSSSWSGFFVVAPSCAQSNMDPSIVEVSGPVEPVNINNQPVSVGVTFSDPNAEDTHIVTWNWGDNTPEVFQSNAMSPVSQTHTYSETGVYSVEITVTDNHNASDSAVYEYIVIYDPEGGFVTGGGWINSLEGAYVADPKLAGKATFGFVSKYQKGANVPTGNTEFQFKVADLNFKSTSYDWLVIAGAKAQYKGIGTINGTGEYRFILTANDGTPDKFRIKIWDKVSGIVIYDNQLGASDNEIPTTAIQGGSIVIHKAK